MSSYPPTGPSFPSGSPYPGGPPLREIPGATAGLVFGILSLVLSIPIVGLILAIIGFRKSAEAKRIAEANPGMYTNAGVAQAGWIVSLIGMIVGCLGAFCGCLYGAIIVVALASGSLPNP